MKQFIRDVATGVSACWRSLVATDLLFKALAFSVLTPLLGLLWQSLLIVAGRSVLSDVDIAMFFVGPFGWFCLIVMGAVWLAIIALEVGALLWILAARSMGSRANSIDALQFVRGHGLNILKITTRLIGWSLLAITPFLLIAGGVYRWLLSDYDINYYLNENPMEFKIAVTLGVVLGCVLVGFLLRIHSSWFMALPLVLFDRVNPKDALRISKALTDGHRVKVLKWLATWMLSVFVANVLITALVGGLGRTLIPEHAESLILLATRVGLMLSVLVAASLLLNLLATIIFAGVLFHGYQEINPNSASAISAIFTTDRTEAGRSGSIFTLPRLVAGGVITVLLAALIGYWLFDSIKLQDDVDVMAHRGASNAAPENTLAAIHKAIEDGADWVEIDVQETADGEVVVVHDSDFMKVANNSVKIWDADYADLADIDIGSWFDPVFVNERVPKLSEVLQLCKDKVGVNIELKYYGHDQQLEQRVIDIVEAENMADQIMIMSLKSDGVAKTKALRPDWKCGLLMSVHVGKLQNIKADFLAVNSSFATRNFVKRAHNAGKEVFVWTVNDSADMSRMMNRKVDGILTDRPELAREVLRQRAEMDIRERLLTEISALFNQPTNKVEQ